MRKYLCILLAAMGIVCFSRAESTPVAQIGETTYTSLADAINEAKEMTGDVVVTLTADLNLSGWTMINLGITSGKSYDSLVLDGNGKTVTGLTQPLFGNMSYSPLTIKNITFKDSAVTEATAAGHTVAGIIVPATGNGGSITLDGITVEGGTITSSSSYAAALIAYKANGCDVTINDCKVTGVTITGANSSGALFGHTMQDFTVTNTTVGGNTINNTSDKVKSGVLIGTLNTADEDTIDVTEESATKTQYNGTAVDAKLIGRLYAGVTYTGGEYFTNPNDSYAKKDDNGSVTVDGKLVEQDGKWLIAKAQIDETYYTTLQKAIDAATADANEITLLGNVTEAMVTVETGKNVVIDFDEKTLNGSMFVEKGATADIKNGTIYQTESVAGIEVQGVAILTAMDITSEGRHAIRVDGLNTEGTKLTVNSGTYTTTAPLSGSYYAVNAGEKSVVEIKGGEFVGNGGGQGAFIVKSEDTLVSIEGGEFYNGTAIIMQVCNSTVITGGIYGGTGGVRPAEGYVLEYKETEGVYEVVKATQWIQVADTSWYKAGTTSFELSTPKQIAGIAKLVNAGTTLKGVTITLPEKAEIDFAGLTWSGIGVYDETLNANVFQGTFNGNGAIFKNVTFANTSANKYRGFFNQIYNATVQNVTVEVKGFEAGTEDNYGGAAIAGCANNSTIASCVSTGSFTATHNVAGIVVRVKDSTILNCTNKANISNNYTKMGGIVALVQRSESEVLIDGCVNEGNITSTAHGEDGVGGIAGWVGYPNTANITISNCKNTGKITATATATIGQIAAESWNGNHIFTGNKGLTTQVATGHAAMNGLNYALVTDSVAAYVNDDALEAGKTYLVTAAGAKPVIKLAPGASISFDQTLASIDDSGITSRTGITETTNGDETTYTADYLTIDDFKTDLENAKTGNDYVFDGEGVTYKWTLPSTVNSGDANAPDRYNTNNAQYYLLGGVTGSVSLTNVNFVFTAPEGVVSGNIIDSGKVVKNAQLYFQNTGNFTVTGCTFDGVILTNFEGGAGTTATVTDCTFKNITDGYAIKDIRGETIVVENNTFTTCGAGVMVSAKSATDEIEEVIISGNSFENVGKYSNGTDKGLVQLAGNGVYAEGAIKYAESNTVTGDKNGSTFWQLNTSAVTQVQTLVEAGKVTVTENSVKPVAQVNGKSYATLQAAADAAVDGNTIVLVGNSTKGLNASNYNKAITIDLAGFEITNADSKADVFVIASGATVTITDSSENGTGKVTASYAKDNGTDPCVAWIKTGGKLIVEGGTFSCGADVDSYWGYAFDSSGELVINGGTFVQGGQRAGVITGNYMVKAGFELVETTEGTFEVVVSDADTSWYDNAEEGTTSFTITTAGQLKGLAQLVNGGNTFAGKTVTLGADIDLSTLTNQKNWAPIGTTLSTPFSGTFNGAGYTISNLKIETEVSYLGLFGAVTDGIIEKVNIANVTLVANKSSNTYIGSVVGYLKNAATLATVRECTVSGTIKLVGYAWVGGVVGYCYGNPEKPMGIIENCHVNGTLTMDSVAYTGGILGRSYVSRVKDCTVTGGDASALKALSYLGGVVGFSDEGTRVAVENCSVKNITLSSTDTVGGIAGMAHYGNHVVGCSVDNVKLLVSGTDGTSGMIVGSSQATAASPIILADNTVVNSTNNGAASSVQFSGVTSTGAVNTNYFVGTGVELNANNMVPNGLFTVYPEAIASAILAPGAVAIDNNDGTWTVKTVMDTSWYDENVNSFVLTTSPELAGFAKLVTDGKTFEGKTVTLGKDITIAADYTWPGAGVYSESDNSKAFQGTFDGAGYTISNMTFTTGKYRGFFNLLYNATVKNVTIDCTGFEEDASGTYGGAVIAGFANNSTIESCVATGTLSGTHNVAGVAVRIKNATIKNCTNKAALTGSYTKLGGIVCLSQNSTTGCLLEGCVNEGTITSTTGGADGVGGIIGWIGSRSDDGASADEGQRVTIKDCINEGAITGSSTALIGQIVGKPFSYWSIQGANKGLTTTLAVGYGETSGLNFATVEGNVATYVSTLDFGKTYLVTAPNAKATLKLTAGQQITFDQTLATVDVTVSSATTGIDVEEEPDAEKNTVTYFVPVAKVGDAAYASFADIPGGTTVQLLAVPETIPTGVTIQAITKGNQTVNGTEGAAKAAFDAAEVLGGSFSVTQNADGTTTLTYAYEFGIAKLTYADGKIHPVAKLTEAGDPVVNRTLTGRTLVATSSAKDENDQPITLTMADPEFDENGLCEIVDDTTDDGFSLNDLGVGNGATIEISITDNK